MKLTTKLIAITLLIMAILTVLVGWFATSREWQLLKTEHEETARQVADSSRDMLVASWRTGGKTAVERAAKSEFSQTSRLDIRWCWFETKAIQTELGKSSEIVVSTLSVGRMYTTIQNSAGDGRVHTYVPIINANAKLGGLDISDSAVRVGRRIRVIWWTTGGAILSLFLLSGVSIAWLGFHFVGKPLKKLVEKTERVSEGDFSHPLVFKSNDELQDLANALNQMCSKLSEQQSRIDQETQSKIDALNQLRHTDRLQTMGQLSSGVAHELGTPLNVISGHAELITSGKMSVDEMTESAETIRAETKRMTGIVRQLLDFSRSKPTARTTVDLNNVLRATIELLHSVSYKVNVNLLFDSSVKPALISADEEQLKQVFINLIMNAIQSMPDGGNINTTIKSTDAKPSVARDISVSENGYYCLSIEDQGLGMPASVIEHVFEPFYTTKEVGSGTGLGLSIAYGIIKEHDGWIDVESKEGEGSCFRICLPIHSV